MVNERGLEMGRLNEKAWFLVLSMCIDVLAGKAG